LPTSDNEPLSQFERGHALQERRRFQIKTPVLTRPKKRVALRALAQADQQTPDK
jgi:hypothetical protein